MIRCQDVGSLTVGGKVVGRMRCQLEAGHDTTRVLDPAWPTYIVGPSEHAGILRWGAEAEADLDLADPSEVFDVTLDL